MGEWERRNQELAGLRKALKATPANIELAKRYWHALAGSKAKGEADLRCGSDVMETFREAAVSSKKGIEVFARAYRDLFDTSGESPRPAYFDERLVTALKAEVSGLSGTERGNVEWILDSIDRARESGH
jgi:hypothetical protein